MSPKEKAKKEDLKTRAREEEKLKKDKKKTTPTQTAAGKKKKGAKDKLAKEAIKQKGGVKPSPEAATEIEVEKEISKTLEKYKGVIEKLPPKEPEEALELFQKTTKMFEKTMEHAGIPIASFDEVKKAIEEKKQEQKAKEAALRKYKAAKEKEGRISESEKKAIKASKKIGEYKKGAKPATVTLGEIFEIQKEEKRKEREKKKAPQELKEMFLNPDGFHLVVHGAGLVETKEGELIPKPKTDLDAALAAYLIGLSEAKENFKQVAFVQKGKYVKGAINIDTGHKHGLVVEEVDGVKTAWLDHHDPRKREPTSSTKITLDNLVKLKLIEKEPWMENLAKYITEIDNLSYPLDKKFLKEDWWRSLYGLHKILPPMFIVEQFKAGRDPRKPFEQKEAEKIVVKGMKKVIRKKDGKGKVIEKSRTLWELCEANKKMMNFSISGIYESIAEMAAEKILVFKTPELGKVVINDVGIANRNKIPSGFDVVRAMGFDTQINLYTQKDENGFFISSKKDLEKIYKKKIEKTFPETKVIRGTMLINFRKKGEKKNIDFDKLKDILGLKKEYRKGNRFWWPKEEAEFVVTDVSGIGEKMKYTMKDPKSKNQLKITKSELEKALKKGSLSEYRRLKLLKIGGIKLIPGIVFEQSAKESSVSETKVDKKAEKGKGGKKKENLVVKEIIQRGDEPEIKFREGKEEKVLTRPEFKEQLDAGNLKLKQPE